MTAKARLGWVKLYEQFGDAGVVYRRCGITRLTLRKWWRRHQAEGEARGWRHKALGSGRRQHL